MRKTNSKQTPLTLDLRDRLKSIVESELEGLPQLLDRLEGKERLDVILKLMQLVLPKSKPVHHSENEPTNWSSFV
jgi:hypothetical protein